MGRTGIYACGESVRRRNSLESVALFSLKQEAPASIGGSTFTVVFDENFLMTIATLGAFALAIYEQSGDYLEGIAVMLFYQIGEWFQSYAVGRSRKNISALMDIRPDYANIERDGKLEKVDPDDVDLGTTIVVQPGERVPLDGVVLRGTSSLNTSALTGESLPRDVQQGDEVISGCINMTGVLYVKTTKESEEPWALMQLLKQPTSYSWMMIPCRLPMLSFYRGNVCVLFMKISFLHWG